MAVECCKEEFEKNDGFCSNACYAKKGVSELENLASYVKCPSHFDCGHDRLVFLKEKRKVELSIKNVPKGSLCVYTFDLGAESNNVPINAFVNFRVLEQSSNILAAIVSNWNESLEDAKSGEVTFDYELSKEGGTKSLEILKRYRGDHLLVVV